MSHIGRERGWPRPRARSSTAGLPLHGPSHDRQPRTGIEKILYQHEKSATTPI